jgi:putative acetyltransferase
MKSAETFVAENGALLVGWIELESDGHIEMLYCAPEATRNGTAAQLYAAAISRAQQLGMRKLYCEASLLAESFFTKQGWTVDERETVVRNGVGIPRALMSMILPD